MAALAAALLVVACGSTSTATGQSPAAALTSSPPPAAAAVPSPPAESPTSAAVPSPSESPSTSAASPSPTASPSPWVFTLSPVTAPPLVASGECALPVYWSVSGSQFPEQAGFLIYPTGAVVSPQPVSPQLGEAFYDAAAQRWLPVAPTQVSPDGLQLAYADYDMKPMPNAGMAGESRPRASGALADTGRVHIVDARTGADKIIYSGSPTYAIAGFTAKGIYLNQVTLTMDGEFAGSLFLIGLTGGTPAPVPGGGRQLDRFGWTVMNGAAWGTDFSTGGFITAGNELVRLDLQTGALTVWLTAPAGTGVMLLGFDAGGNPLVSAEATGFSADGSPAPTPPTQLLVLSSPAHEAVLWQTTDPNVPAPYGPVFDDAHGAWIGVNGTVWLDANGSIDTVAVKANGGITLGGPCL